MKVTLKKKKGVETESGLELRHGQYTNAKSAVIVTINCLWNWGERIWEESASELRSSYGIDYTSLAFINPYIALSIVNIIKYLFN